MRDIFHNVLPEVSFHPLLVTAAADGDAIIDMQGFEGALIIITAGAIADGSGGVTKYTWELTHGDNNALSDGVAVPDADLVGIESIFEAVTGATHEENVSKSFSYVGTKRYLRVDLSIVPSTPSSGGTFSAVVVRGHARRNPAQVVA